MISHASSRNACATAFQLLPLGSTDGGRIAQSAYGRGVLALSSLLTYGFLAFGIIGGTLSLQYGLLALLWARSPSRNILNDASEISNGRQVVRRLLLRSTTPFGAPRAHGADLTRPRALPSSAPAQVASCLLVFALLTLLPNVPGEAFSVVVD